jgi:transcription antitermination factor NusG
LGNLPDAAVGNECAVIPGKAARNWFAVYTAPRHEKRVASHFGQRHIECYLPLYQVSHRWKNRRTMELELPLFPGYIFVRIGASERIRVLEVPGVVSIVGGREPVPLPEFEIESLRAGLHLRKSAPHPYLVVGERARIRTGALAGMEGVLIRKKNNLRVVLTLDMIMQSVAVEVDAGDLEPVEKSSRQS